jgi:hypothetical protein
VNPPPRQFRVVAGTCNHTTCFPLECGVVSIGEHPGLANQLAIIRSSLIETRYRHHPPRWLPSICCDPNL